MTSIIHVWQRRSWLLPSTSASRCWHPAPGQDLIPLQRLHVFAHSRDPHPVIKLWCQVPFTKSKTIIQIEMHCMQCFLKSRYIKSRTFNDKNRWIIKKVMVLKKLLPHLATRGTYSPRGLMVRWSVTWANIGVPSSDVPTEVDLLHMRIERHVGMLCIVA